MDNWKHPDECDFCGGAILPDEASTCHNLECPGKIPKRLTAKERERLLALRKQGKLGRIPLTRAERNFCTRMYERDEEGYKQVEEEMLTWLRGLEWWELLG